MVLTKREAPAPKSTRSSCTCICSWPRGQAKCLLEKCFLLYETNTELFGHSNEKFVWRSQNEALRPRITNCQARQWQHYAAGLFLSVTVAFQNDDVMKEEDCLQILRNSSQISS
ncbi:hypothetical protein AMECASPLE_012511 [Ameca splendens]|uniref:Uncharacterized protein n=1 Tax=Ameca splendens TaxID=208324 RepID=A0ABV0ZAP2_9TELE